MFGFTLLLGWLQASHAADLGNYHGNWEGTVSFDSWAPGRAMPPVIRNHPAAISVTVTKTGFSIAWTIGTDHGGGGVFDRTDDQAAYVGHDDNAADGELRCTSATVHDGKLLILCKDPFASSWGVAQSLMLKRDGASNDLSLRAYFSTRGVRQEAHGRLRRDSLR